MKKDNLKRDINFFEQIFRDKTKKNIDLNKDIKTSAKIFGIVAVLSIVLLSVGNFGTKIATRAINSEIEALATPEKIAEIESNKAKVQELTVENQMLQEKIDEFDKSIKLTIQDIKDIAYYQTADVKISSFNYSNGIVSLSVQGNNQLVGANFAQALRASEKFDAVEYTGISGSNGSYSTNIQIKLHRDNVEGKEGGQANE